MTTPNLASRINRIHVGSVSPVFLGNVETGTLLQNESKDAVIYVGQTDVTPANGIAITPGNSAVWQNESLVWAIVDPATADSGSLMVTTAISNVTQVAPYVGSTSTTILSLANVPFNSGEALIDLDDLSGFDAFIISTFMGDANEPGQGQIYVDFYDDNDTVIYEYENDAVGFRTFQFAFPVYAKRAQIQLYVFNYKPTSSHILNVIGVNGMGISQPTNVSQYNLYESFTSGAVAPNTILPDTVPENLGNTGYLRWTIDNATHDLTTFTVALAINRFNAYSPTDQPDVILVITEKDCTNLGPYGWVGTQRFNWPELQPYMGIYNAGDASVNVKLIFSPIGRTSTVGAMS